jgi:hypothetical protein
MKKSKQWKLVRNSWVSTQPVLPGVWQRKEAGHVVRGKARCPRTGKQKDIWRVLPDASAEEALLWLRAEQKRIRAGIGLAPSSRTPFASYATSLLKRKIARGEIVSAAGIVKWEMVLKRLFKSKLAELYVEEMLPSDIEAWKDEVARKIHAGEQAPNTANTSLSVIKVVMAQAKVDKNLAENVAAGIKTFPRGEHRTYTREQPNSLTPSELGQFLAGMFGKFPQHFAMTYMGFALGLRPSSLRPLRRRGPQADVKWDEGLLLVRRSHASGSVMERTKTDVDLEIAVPRLLLDVLKWHVETQLVTPEQRASDLLFAREDGDIRDEKVLRSPFTAVAKAMGIGKRITPRAMRRSFQDLARTAEVRDVVTRSISGHATEHMQRLYSTVTNQEQAASLTRILNMMPAPLPALSTPEGEHLGEQARGR